MSSNLVGAEAIGVLAEEFEAMQGTGGGVGWSEWEVEWDEERVRCVNV